jgi:hypothetical protein
MLDWITWVGHRTRQGLAALYLNSGMVGHLTIQLCPVDAARLDPTDRMNRATDGNGGAGPEVIEI